MVAARPFVVLALIAATAGLLWMLTNEDPVPGAGPSKHQVTVTGPEGEGWFNGTVALENGTALDALFGVAAGEGWPVETEEYAFGDCGTYVTSVRGARAQGSQGWIFEVWDEAAEEWQWATRGAACWNLEPGQAVRWRWSEAPGA